MNNKFLSFKYIRKDTLGGITAGIIALPLALAFGEQSGLGASAGLYGAAFIAFFASLFGGTPTQISGPTAPITAFSMVVVASLLQSFEGRLAEALPLILMVFLLAGLIQIGLGVFKLGTFIKYIPHTVVSGFMTGIGIIILITQVPTMLGYYAGEDTEVAEALKAHAEELILDRILMDEAEDGILVLEEFRETIDRAAKVTEEEIAVQAKLLAAVDAKGVYGAIKYFPRAIQKINYIELIISLLTIVLIYTIRRINKKVPATLISLLLVSGLAYGLGFDYTKIREIPSGYPVFHFDIFTTGHYDLLGPFLISALMLALLGSIDSLLTSVVADNLTKTQHDSNRELVGQGIGNSIAAIFGGLPGAGATIRTVVNIQAGGKTKVSGMIAGIFLFAIVLLLGPTASLIPAAVLAGILITVGFGVIDYKGLRDLPRMDLSERSILITVLVLTVFWQLVYAVAIGLILASVLFLKRMSDTSAKRVVISNLDRANEGDALWGDEVDIDSEVREKVMFKHMNGPMFFGITSHFRNLISELGDIHLLVIRMEKVPFIDHSGITALEAAINELHEKDVIVALSGTNHQSLVLLIDMNIIPDVVADRHVFHEFSMCRDWLKEILQKENGLEEELKLLKDAKK